MHFLKPNARHTPPLMEALSMGALLALQQFFPDEFEDSERAWSELVRDAEAWARECEQFRSRALNFELYEDKRGLAIDEQRRMIASRASMSLSDLLARIRAHKRTLFVELGLSPDVSDDALMADLSEIVRRQLRQAPLQGARWPRQDPRAEDSGRSSADLRPEAARGSAC
jgi:hypothetical protein